MKGLLNFLSSPAGQRFGAGMRGLSAGLLQAGAPRVGAPGPNAWGAGLSGFSQGIEAEREKARAMAMQDLQKKLLVAQSAQAQAEADKINRTAKFRERVMAPYAAKPQARGAGVTPVQVSPLPAIPGSNVAPGGPTQPYMTPPDTQVPPAQAAVPTGPLGKLTPEQIQVVSGLSDDEFEKFAIKRLTESGISEGTGRQISQERAFTEAYQKKIDPHKEVIDQAMTADAIFMQPVTAEQQQQRAAAVQSLVGSGDVVIRDTNGNPVMSLSKTALDDPNAAGDIALVFTFMKSLDPRSTVRDGEFQMAAGIGGWADRVQSWFSEISGSGKLTGEQRKQIMRTIRSQALRAQGEIARINKAQREYVGRYGGMGISLDRTIPQYTPRKFNVPSQMFYGGGYNPPGRGS